MSSLSLSLVNTWVKGKLNIYGLVRRRDNVHLVRLTFEANWLAKSSSKSGSSLPSPFSGYGTKSKSPIREDTEEVKQDEKVISQLEAVVRLRDRTRRQELWHVLPQGEWDQIQWVGLKINKGLARFGEKRMVRPDVLLMSED